MTRSTPRDHITQLGSACSPTPERRLGHLAPGARLTLYEEKLESVRLPFSQETCSCRLAIVW